MCLLLPQSHNTIEKYSETMTTLTPYSYKGSVKSDISDELINTYLVRPIAGFIVFLLYRTRISPNQITIAAIVAGLIAAVLYGYSSAPTTFAAGILLWTKDVLDSADGQLARARGTFSRAGRFLDSIGDFVVNLAVFTAITATLCLESGSAVFLILGIVGFLGISLRISYHVFYQVSFLHLEGAYTLNRTSEEIRQEDQEANQFTLHLQQIYLVMYGWQDRFMERLDSWCRGMIPWKTEASRRWYSDQIGLRMSGLLGMGTELFLLVVFSLLDRLDWYLYINAFLLNGLWLATVIYRRRVLAPHLTRGQN